MTLTKPNYVLVDYENVQAMDLERVVNLPVKVVLFLGQNQKSVPVDLLRKACSLPGQVEVVESVATGKNAVDFQMACYAGRIAEREPTAFIHFVSRDKGFDAVVLFLRAVDRFAARSDSFSALMFLNQKDYGSMSSSERVDYVISRLSRIAVVSRPRRLRTLKTSVGAMFAKQLDDTAVEKVIADLRSRKKIVVGEKETISYQIEAEPGATDNPDDAQRLREVH